MTMSLLKDGGANINNFNPTGYGGVNKNHYLEADSYEIKEEEDEYCQTPLTQFYEDQPGYQ